MDVEELVLETRRLLAANLVLQDKLRARRVWRLTGLGLVAVLIAYAWSINALLAENLLLLRTNTELVQSGNALLRAANTRQQEMQSALKQMRPPLQPGKSETPRRRIEGCPAGSPGCDPSTYWVPGFPGPRVSAKRTALQPSI